ncbi:MAG: GNAT family N-acetyltransferase [Candidatus Elarobacter sp.]
MLIESTGVESALQPAAGTVTVALLRPDGRLDPSGETVYRQIARLLVDAYPIMGIDGAAAWEDFVERLTARAHEEGTAWAVARRDGEIVGVMHLYDYVMNLRGSDVTAGGVGSVAVSLLHKRQGIARTMIAWYLQAYRERGATMAVLHPFRPDFYRSLGFGYGTPTHRYRLQPAAIRADGAAGTIRLLEGADAEAVFACCERVRAHTNGLIRKHPATLARAMSDGATRWIGVEDGGTLRAFMQTSAVLGAAGTTNANELIVRDFNAEDEASGAALFGYLRAQRGQFTRIVFETQDDAFYLNADDPRDAGDVIVAPPAVHRVAETGLGMMYRILDLERALAQLGPAAQRFVLRIECEDALFPPTGGAHSFVFGPSAPPLADDAARPDATLRIGIADLSSLVAGSLHLGDLLRHRLASIVPAGAAEQAARLLDAASRPVCNARF